MTVSEFAEKHDVPYQSAIRWARKNLIPGAKLTQFGKITLYMIPDDAVPPKLPTGRPKKAPQSKSSNKGSKKSKKGKSTK